MSTAPLNYDPTDPDKMRLPVGTTCGDCVNIRRTGHNGRGKGHQMTNTQDTLNKPEKAAVLALAQRMAKAAGKCKPMHMVQASYMLLQCAAMAGQPDTYIDWKIKMDAKK